MTPRSVRILGSEESSFATWGSRPPRAWGRDPQCEKTTNRVGAGLEAAVELLNGDLVGVDLQFLLQLVQILLLLLGLAVFLLFCQSRERTNKQTHKKKTAVVSRESRPSHLLRIYQTALATFFFTLFSLIFLLVSIAQPTKRRTIALINNSLCREWPTFWQLRQTTQFARRMR